MECNARREKTKKPRADHIDKRLNDWAAVQKIEVQRKAQKRRKLIARKRRKAYQDFVKSEFEGVSILMIES